MAKVTFSFDDKSAKKLKNKKNILGGKGANLGEMGRLGLPVPPGFTITTEVCDLFYKNKKKLPNKVIQYIFNNSNRLFLIFWFSSFTTTLSKKLSVDSFVSESFINKLS